MRGDVLAAFAAGRQAEMAFALHKLRGSAATLGANEVAGAIGAIEKAIAGGIAAECADLVAAYEVALERLLANLRDWRGAHGSFATSRDTKAP